MRIQYVLLLLLLSSCHSRLSVERDYITRYDLASSYTCTPDPCYNCPPQGERLYIDWSLPIGSAAVYSHSLFVQIRFRNHESSYFTVPIYKDRGSYLYTLCDDDYFTLGGILGYKVQLFANGELLREWTHPMWQERILLPD